MNNGSSKGSCQTMCWVAAAVGGIITAFILHGVATWGWMGAVFFGALIFVIAGALLATYVCADALPRPVAAAPADGFAAHPGAASLAAARPATIAPAATQPATIAPASVVTAMPIATSAVSPAHEPRAVQTAEPAAKPAVATTLGAAPAKTAQPAVKPIAPNGKPEMLAQPRGGAGDDLKQIKGVGPKLEQMLNTMGVWHFEQVAGWRKAEVRWVDENLEGFKGRVTRDDWVKQAKVLAAGGVTEFSNRAKKGAVY